MYHTKHYKVRVANSNFGMSVHGHYLRRDIQRWDLRPQLSLEMESRKESERRRAYKESGGAKVEISDAGTYVGWMNEENEKGQPRSTLVLHRLLLELLLHHAHCIPGMMSAERD